MRKFKGRRTERSGKRRKETEIRGLRWRLRDGNYGSLFAMSSVFSALISCRVAAPFFLIIVLWIVLVFGSCIEPVHNKVISGFQALRQVRAPMAGLEPATEGSLRISGRICYPLCHRRPFCYGKQIISH
ncbi:hypothetical protein PoB_004255800 [Plakobranchus ocellatus]|uniref:Uncharacterized protein n=1 Tax=Plakobranchus ocellatus TaxID=259542 RepID=A0AAV4BA69_9GAST|nr:hypothetical protein PoB_004255800 [Plakobranchus ocellatus]